MVEFLTQTFEVPLWALLLTALIATAQTLVLDRMFWAWNRHRRLLDRSALEIVVEVDATQAEAALACLGEQVEALERRILRSREMAALREMVEARADPTAVAAKASEILREFDPRYRDTTIK
jgi:hypothetical protein